MLNALENFNRNIQSGGAKLKLVHSSLIEHDADVIYLLPYTSCIKNMLTSRIAFCSAYCSHATQTNFRRQKLSQINSRTRPQSTRMFMRELHFCIGGCERKWSLDLCVFQYFTIKKGEREKYERERVQNVGVVVFGSGVDSTSLMRDAALPSATMQLSLPLLALALPPSRRVEKRVRLKSCDPAKAIPHRIPKKPCRGFRERRRGN